jgi:two-component system, OmpR family, phosphate regulon sensor histidine kinase PhoR
LRSPLNSINMAATMLYEERFPMTELQKKEYYRIFKNQSQTLINNIDKILILAKAEQTQLVITKKPVQIKNYIDELATQFVENNQHIKPIELSVDIEPNDFELWMDAEKMKSVLNNVLDNAVKYSYNDLKLSIKIIKTNQKVCICIKDNGIGIAPNDLDAIFENFGQGNVLERKRVFGYGIGLSFVKKIVEAHGGNISVTSKETEGSEFKLELPA